MLMIRVEGNLVRVTIRFKRVSANKECLRLIATLLYCAERRTSRVVSSLSPSRTKIPISASEMLDPPSIWRSKRRRNHLTNRSRVYVSIVWHCCLLGAQALIEQVGADRPSKNHGVGIHRRFQPNIYNQFLCPGAKSPELLLYRPRLTEKCDLVDDTYRAPAQPLVSPSASRSQ
jgi:hypothetical protein